MCLLSIKSGHLPVDIGVYRALLQLDLAVRSSQDQLLTAVVQLHGQLRHMPKLIAYLLEANRNFVYETSFTWSKDAWDRFGYYIFPYLTVS